MMWINAVFVTILCSTFLHLGCHGYRDLIFLPCEENTSFTGHLTKVINVTADWLENCQLSCYVDLACVSFNLGSIEGEERNCEMSKSDHVAYPNHVIKRVGHIYCPIKNPCSSSPCAQDKMCQPEWSFKTYVCTHNCSTCAFFRRCKPKLGCVGYTKVCSQALGMEDKTIPDFAITSNAQHRPQGYLSSNEAIGRLNARYGWTPEMHHSPSPPYLQIQLQMTHITKLASQGCTFVYPNKEFEDGWVDMYQLKHGNETGSLRFYRQQGVVKNFVANSNVHTIKLLSLPSPVVSTIVRFYPVTWKNFVCMRVELYGCK